MNVPYDKFVLVLVVGLLAACGGSDRASDSVSETTSNDSIYSTSDSNSTSDADRVFDGDLDSDETSPCTAVDLPLDAVRIDGYRQLELCGWQVFMNDHLYDDDLATEVYSALAEDLRMVIDVVPEPAVEFLRDTKIWLELDETAFPGGVYHPSAEWLGENGYPAKWEKGVQFGNARNYLDWPAQQPAMLLHEFSHALYDQLYDFEQPDITAAYEGAMQAGLYDSVEYVDGGSRQAYATSDAIEYLAEISEAYYWVNDFYPFDRQELAAHDPVGMAAVELVWQMR